MRFGLFVPAFAELADPRRVADLAHTAEESGWEGFYLWDHVLRPGGMGVADPWVTLAAVATATERVRIGTLVTPLARRRPWVLARQVSTLDHLSGGLPRPLDLGLAGIGGFLSAAVKRHTHRCVPLLIRHESLADSQACGD